MTSPSGTSPSKNPLADLTPAQADARAKSEILIEALPWMQRFRGKIVVVKYGGNAMIDDDLRRAFAADMVFMRRRHSRRLVRGGPDQRCWAASASSRVRGGLRVTDETP